MSFSKGPSFRIIIVQDKKTYKIPKLFREKYWKATPNPIILRLRNGYEQKIFWVESKGEILFQKNWKSFSKLLNLSHGCVLTFKYIGGSHFKVKVFGPKCLEINYSNIIYENEDDVEAREKANENIEVSDESEDDEIEIPMQTQRKRKFQGRNRENEDVNDENPFFEVVMTRVYVNGCFMWIPTNFSRIHLNNFKGISTLRVGKDTPMEVKIRFDGNYNKSMMCGGWKRFSQKYNLQVKDTCKFVMTQHQPLSFIVIINRARKVPSPKNFQEKSNSCDSNIAKRRYIGETSMSRRRRHFVEDSEGGNRMKPFTFKIWVKDNYGYPDLPKEFMNIGCDVVELKMGRQSWFVKVKNFDSLNHSRFGKGWRPFIEECNLIGKICSFELIDEIDFVFNVSVV